MSMKPTDPCDPNPCHHGVCHPRGAGGFLCHCTGTGWYGDTCRKSKLKTHFSILMITLSDNDDPRMSFEDVVDCFKIKRR